MYKFFINILTDIFVSKKARYKVKHYLLTIFKLIKVKLKAKYVGKNLTVSHVENVRVSKHTVIGNYVSLSGIEILGSGNITIGDYCAIGKDCLISTDNHNYNGEQIPFDHTVIKKAVIIEPYVWIGARVTILPGTTIGEGAIIQAGSVVHGHIPPMSIAGGNPAKVFKQRDIEHYNKLKNEKKFFVGQ